MSVAPLPAGALGAVPTRDWAVATFVVWHDRIMLHQHAKLGIWLPCGGHVEPGELPDEAAIREVLEESGVAVRLVGTPPVAVAGPRPLTPPRGVQLSQIGDGHEHIDLIYFAVPEGDYAGELVGEPTLGWYAGAALDGLPLTEEIRAWTRLALEELRERPGPRPSAR